MKYRKKPVVIEAIQYTGVNLQKIMEFADTSKLDITGVLKIGTLEGDMITSKGDYIIKGVNGEFYPCKQDIFLKTYERV